MKRFLATLFFLVLSATAWAQQPKHDTFVELNHGNIDLEVLDGTTISMAPETHLAIDPAERSGDITHIKVEKGQFHVSNALHKHSDVLHVQVGEHTFELHRGAALFSHTPDGLHATLIHGRALGRVGHPQKITRPGMRMMHGPGGFKHVEHPKEDMQRMMNRVGGPGARGLGPGGQGKGKGKGRGQGNGPRQGKKPGKKKSLGPANLGPADLLQQTYFQTQTQIYQGAAPPPPRPPKPPGGGGGGGPKPPGGGGGGGGPKPPMGGGPMNKMPPPMPNPGPKPGP